MNDNRNGWDAQTYDEISRIVQYQWSLQVLKWREWNGKEIVMDAGCGSGHLTKLLAEKVPRGKVYAVDSDINMIRQAKRNLAEVRNVEIVLADLIKVKLDLELDVIFSNAVLHWIHDHIQVFQHFWKMLKCNGLAKTELLIQCGGHGNLRGTLAVLQKITELKEFREYFSNMSIPWYFAKPDDTSKLLKRIGFTNTNVNLHNDYINLINRKIYRRFVKTVIMKPFLEQLPEEKIKNEYLESFLNEVENNSFSSNESQTTWSLDYVRLNIIAEKP